MWTLRKLLHHRAITRCGHHYSVQMRFVTSESFEVMKGGQPVRFTSKKSDSDVIVALKGFKGNFGQHLYEAGVEGKWSKTMRAWAHYLSQDHAEETEDPSKHLDANILVRVDSREKKLIECLRKRMEIPFCVETLRVGDVILGSFPYEIYIERKAVCDLVSSVFDCRLVNQIGNQLHHTEYCRLQSLVIVEGDFSELNQPMPHLRHLKKLSYEGLRNLALATMVRLSLRDQLPVLRSDNLQGTAELINVISLEYPKLLKMRPLQYGSRKERPFRSRRGENPKETLASQLRCVRGVSEQAGRRLARNHDHVQSFLSAMLASADPVQWLVDKANIGKNSSPLRRPTAVRLAETLAGKDTLQRENFTSSLEAIQGISRTSATALVGHFSTRENMQQFLEGQCA